MSMLNLSLLRYFYAQIFGRVIFTHYLCSIKLIKLYGHDRKYV